MKMKIKYGFGENLRKFRKLFGYSQIKLAKKLGLPPSTISHFENETRLPSYQNLFLIGRRTGWDINKLMGLDDSGVYDFDTMKLEGKLQRIADILKES
jgi:transcriptional regulator with XRE-family HTH domain